jgi:hypothetical protein
MEKCRQTQIYFSGNKKGLINQTFRMGLTFELIFRPRNFERYMRIRD